MYVYFIQQGDRGPIKIGVARNVRKRLQTLQTANSFPLFVRHAIFMGRASWAYRLESRLHNKFKKYHATGEWFFIQWALPMIMQTNFYNFVEVFKLPRKGGTPAKKFREQVRRKNAELRQNV